MFKALNKIFLLILHLPAIGLIFYFWKPISSWYLAKKPALGVDLYLSITYAVYHLKALHLPFNSFKDFWFGGYPLMQDYPQLAFYFMVPFVQFLGSGVGVQTFGIASFLLLLLFCYLLFFQLSKNYGLAIFLSILVTLSPNMYGALIWAGSLPYFFSQAFFPLVLFFGAKYLEKPARSSLAGMILVTGVGVLINPLGIAAFFIPASLIILLISGIFRLKFTKIVLGLILYLVGLVLASFIYFYQTVINAIRDLALPGFLVVTRSTPGGAASASSASSNPIAAFYASQVQNLYTSTDNWLFIALAAAGFLLLISFPLTKEKNRIRASLAFLLICGYSALHPYLNLSGKLSIFGHDPYRAFWPFPIAIASLIAALFGFFNLTVLEKLKKLPKSINHTLIFTLIVISSLVFVSLSFQRFNQQIRSLLNTLDSRSELSSAFPEGLSIDLSEENLSKLKKQVAPSFMNPNDKNTRLYSADATVNIWWNSFFDIPLVRGYIDPPIASHNRGGLFWLDIAIANDSLVRDFKASEDIAFNNSLFLIDWYGIGFFEGGRISSKGPSPGPSSYLIKNHVFDKEEQVKILGAMIKWQTTSGKPELNLDVPQYLHFYKVADEFRSPILYPTNSPAILVFNNPLQFEDILRILASQNLNSKTVIPVWGGGFIDDFNLDMLMDFDAIFLSGYSYHNKNKAFKLIDQYLKKGGKVFIDTGEEGPESSNTDLPEFMPISNSQRVSLGRDWRIQKTQDPITDSVDVTKFGPLIFNGSDWKISSTKDNGELRPDSKVLLTQNNKPILVERNYGQGKVIWSGFNLTYHFNQYKSEAESKLFINILSQFIKIEPHPILEAKTAWLHPEQVQISTDTKPRGILFKEQGYPGWVAKATSEGKNLPVYVAGPTFPGFIYVSTRNLNKLPLNVEFNYHGQARFWLATLINLLTDLVLLDLLIFKGKVSFKIYNPVFLIFKKRVRGWWERENEGD